MKLLVPSLTACYRLLMSKEHTVFLEIRHNLEFLSCYYKELDNERLYEVYQKHFNQTIPYEEAGYRSVLELFTRGQILQGLFGCSKGEQNGYYFKLTSYKCECDTTPPLPNQTSSTYNITEPARVHLTPEILLPENYSRYQVGSTINLST